MKILQGSEELSELVWLKIRAGGNFCKHRTFVKSTMDIWSIELRGTDSATVEILRLVITLISKSTLTLWLDHK